MRCGSMARGVLRMLIGASLPLRCRGCCKRRHSSRRRALRPLTARGARSFPVRPARAAFCRRVLLDRWKGSGPCAGPESDRPCAPAMAGGRVARSRNAEPNSPGRANSGSATPEKPARPASPLSTLFRSRAPVRAILARPVGRLRAGAPQAEAAARGGRLTPARFARWHR